MKTVDILYPTYMNAIIGPVGTLRRIQSNRDYFLSRGYDITIFTLESFMDIKNQNQSGSVKSRIPLPIAKLLKSLVAWWRLFLRRQNRYANKRENEWKQHIYSFVDQYLAERRNPDLIQFHVGTGYDCLRYLKVRNRCNKVVLFEHNDGNPFNTMIQYYPRFETSKYFKKIVSDFEWTIDNTDKLVFIAKNGQLNFLKSFNIPVEKTTVILNGIDDLSEDQRNIADKIKKSSYEFNFRLCCAGSMNTRKGQKIIIEALSRLDKEAQSKIHLDLIGDGVERPVLEDLVEKNHLSDNVTFYGKVPNAEVYKVLAKNNIFILMSKNEGLPISIIEAMRSGLAIISTKIAGIPELVRKDYNGLLLKPDVEELEMVLSNLDEYNWEKMGENSRARFEKEFTFDRMKQELCDMYDSCFN